MTQLRTAEQRYWMQPSLTELDTRLDPARFFRVSRSAIGAISTDILDFRARVLAIQGGTGRLVDSDSDT